MPLGDFIRWSIPLTLLGMATQSSALPESRVVYVETVEGIPGDVESYRLLGTFRGTRSHFVLTIDRAAEKWHIQYSLKRGRPVRIFLDATRYADILPTRIRLFRSPRNEGSATVVIPYGRAYQSCFLNDVFPSISFHIENGGLSNITDAQFSSCEPKYKYLRFRRKGGAFYVEGGEENAAQ